MACSIMMGHNDFQDFLKPQRGSNRENHGKDTFSLKISQEKEYCSGRMCMFIWGWLGEGNMLWYKFIKQNVKLTVKML